MSSWVKTLATKPNKLCSVPGPYMVGGENSSCKLSSDHRHAMAFVMLHVCGKVGNKDTAADLVTVMSFCYQ